MVTKKRGRKISKKVKKISKKNVKEGLVRSTKRKMKLVLKNLILFTILTLASFLLYTFSNNELFRSLFGLLAMILGFVGLAFLIVFLALWILKLMKK
ncbi:hypothetical protein KAT24_00560 [Candidatus Pacearchaeota archaeon]|nr:hypothetical protein [Candidatus Pacearchaeota archaeon]